MAVRIIVIVPLQITWAGFSIFIAFREALRPAQPDIIRV